MTSPSEVRPSPGYSLPGSRPWPVPDADRSGRDGTALVGRAAGRLAFRLARRGRHAGVRGLTGDDAVVRCASAWR